MARPTKFTLVLADQICERLADGESLRSICLGDKMPGKATVFRWLRSHEKFRDQYVRAREAQADALFDEILDIADEDCTMVRADGDEFPIVFTAKAQKKSEWAAIRDAHRKTIDGEDAPAEKAEFSFEDLVKDGMRHAAEMVAGAVSGWNLEDEFTVDSLIVLEDQCGGSLAKVLNKYDAALFTGQLGN